MGALVTLNWPVECTLLGSAPLLHSSGSLPVQDLCVAGYVNESPNYGTGGWARIAGVTGWSFIQGPDTQWLGCLSCHWHSQLFFPPTYPTEMFKLCVSPCVTLFSDFMSFRFESVAMNHVFIPPLFKCLNAALRFLMTTSIGIPRWSRTCTSMLSSLIDSWRRLS